MEWGSAHLGRDSRLESRVLGVVHATWDVIDGIDGGMGDGQRFLSTRPSGFRDWRMEMVRRMIGQRKKGAGGRRAAAFVWASERARRGASFRFPQSQAAKAKLPSSTVQLKLDLACLPRSFSSGRREPSSIQSASTASSSLSLIVTLVYIIRTATANTCGTTTTYNEAC